MGRVGHRREGSGLEEVKHLFAVKLGIIENTGFLVKSAEVIIKLHSVLHCFRSDCIVEETQSVVEGNQGKAVLSMTLNLFDVTALLQSVLSQANSVGFVLY